MKSGTVFSRLSTAQLFVALAGGVALYLIPRDAQGIHSPLQELYVAGVAGIICVLILIFFKSYETMGLSLLIGMSFLILNFLGSTCFQWFETAGADRNLAFQLDYHLGILWALDGTFSHLFDGTGFCLERMGYSPKADGFFLFFPLVGDFLWRFLWDLVIIFFNFKPPHRYLGRAPGKFDSLSPDYTIFFFFYRCGLFSVWKPVFLYSNRLFCFGEPAFDGLVEKTADCVWNWGCDRGKSVGFKHGYGGY